MLRRAMDGLLPPEIQWRPGKADLSPCFFHNLLSDDHDLLLRTLASGMGLLAPYLETTRLREHVLQWSSDETWLRRHWKPLWFPPRWRCGCRAASPSNTTERRRCSILCRMNCLVPR